jgi:hypothetical protein
MMSAAACSLWRRFARKRTCGPSFRLFRSNIWDYGCAASLEAGVALNTTMFAFFVSVAGQDMR